jgi:predicted O-methyltransferase YrrM
MAVGGNTAYAGITDLPPLVGAAVELATSRSFAHSCDPAQGRLLSVLAGGQVGGRIGETGTGCGVGLAWMLDATDESTSIVSVLDGGGKGKEPGDDRDG